MNKIVLSFFVVLLAFAIVSCGGEKKEEPAGDTSMEQMDTQEPETMEEQAPDTADIGDIQDEEVQKEEMKEEKKESPKEEKKAMADPNVPIEGTVVSLYGLVTSGKMEVNKAEAIDLVNRDQLLGFKDSKGTIWIVYNTDGSYAGKNLARHADGKLGIKGKKRNIKGANILIADEMIPM